MAIAEGVDRAIREDPLFAAEGMDLENAERALAALRERLERLEHAFSGGALMRRLFFIRRPLATHAIPLEFLAQFLASERARRAYLDKPSPDSAAAVLAQWQRAARAYAADAARYRALHRTIAALEHAGRDFMLQDLFGNRSSMAYLEESLGAIERNGVALIAEADRRAAGAFDATGRRVSALPAIETSALTDEQRRLHELEIAEGTTPFRQARIDESHGPLRYSARAFDGAMAPHAFIAYILTNERTGIRSFWPAVVDTYLFTKVWDRRAEKGGAVGKTDFVYGGGHTKEEMPYWYHAAAHLYSSREVSHWIDLAAHVDLMRRPELEKDRIAAQRSSLFDLLLGSGVIDLDLYLRHTLRRARTNTLKSYSLLYGLLMRSHPALYYLPFNRSVWRLEENAQFLGDSRAADALALYAPAGEVVRELSAETLGRVMGAQRIREERERREGWWS